MLLNTVEFNIHEDKKDRKRERSQKVAEYKTNVIKSYKRPPKMQHTSKVPQGVYGESKSQKIRKTSKRGVIYCMLVKTL